MGLVRRSLADYNQSCDFESLEIYNSAVYRRGWANQRHLRTSAPMLTKVAIHDCTNHPRRVLLACSRSKLPWCLTVCCHVVVSTRSMATTLAAPTQCLMMPCRCLTMTCRCLTMTWPVPNDDLASANDLCSTDCAALDPIELLGIVPAVQLHARTCVHTCAHACACTCKCLHACLHAGMRACRHGKVLELLVELFNFAPLRHVLGTQLLSVHMCAHMCIDLWNSEALSNCRRSSRRRPVSRRCWQQQAAVLAAAGGGVGSSRRRC